MQQYLNYMFQTFTIKSSSPEFNSQIKDGLLELKPLDLTKHYKNVTLSPVLFNQLTILLAKGVVKYSASNCTIELSLPNLMIYQRLFKIQIFAKKYLDSNVAEFIQQFIEQGMDNGMGFPIKFEKKKIQNVFKFHQSDENPKIQSQQSKKKAKSKPKHNQMMPSHAKQAQELYNYHKLVYEYRSKQKQSEINSLNPEKKTQNAVKKSKSHSKHKQGHQQQNMDFEECMLNIEEVTRLLQASKLVEIVNAKLGAKQNKMSLFQFLNSKDKQILIQEIKYQKIEQFIAQVLSPDCLLVFNLVKKYPFITEKELTKLTLMEVLHTRASLNQLIEKGFLYFYNQNPRTVVYKILDARILESKYLDTIAKSLLNLCLFSQKISHINGMHVSSEKIKQKIIEIECQIQRLDDILLIFGW